MLPSSVTLLAVGQEGAARIPDGPRLGTLTAWRLVISPTTGRRTLIAEGQFLRFWVGARITRVVVEATPTQAPARIGRKSPPAPRPFRLVGRVDELSTRALVVTEEPSP
jgi:hypothetical protein